MYDVIIVGAGVAGSYLGYKLSQERNLNVLILEKDKKTILKDSGIVSSKFLEFFPRKFVKNEISRMDFVSPSGKRMTIQTEKPFAFILKREQFSRHLRKNAKNIKYETVEKIIDGKIYTNKNEYEYKILVGADGANSIVAKHIGSQTKNAVGMFSIAKRIKFSEINIFLNKNFSDFFSWIIPQNKEYGLIANKNPKKYFEIFRNKLNLPPGKFHAFPIPVGYTKSYADNCLLVGDACGYTKPLTGGGIIFSLISSQHASEIILDAFQKNRFDSKFLKRYEKACSPIRKEIDRQLWIRNIYENLSNKDIEYLFREFSAVKLKNIRENYDKLSNIGKEIPKLKMLKAFFKVIF